MISVQNMDTCNATIQVKRDTNKQTSQGAALGILFLLVCTTIVNALFVSCIPKGPYTSFRGDSQVVMVSLHAPDPL